MAHFLIKNQEKNYSLSFIKENRDLNELNQFFKNELKYLFYIDILI